VQTMLKSTREDSMGKIAGYCIVEAYELHRRYEDSVWITFIFHSDQEASCSRFAHPIMTIGDTIPAILLMQRRVDTSRLRTNLKTSKYFVSSSKKALMQTVLPH